MSDEALREAERRWRSSQALDDGVAWMQLRLRTGDRAAVELLAELGDAAARAALPETKWLEPDKWLKTLEQWLLRLGARGPEELVRTHVALARVAPMSPIGRGRGAPAVRLAIAALEAAERWLVEPTEQNGQAARAAGEAALAATARARSNISAIEAMTFDAIKAALAIGDPAGARPSPHPRMVWTCPWPYHARSRLTVPHPVHAIRDAVRRELLPWALGEHDPVLDRIRSALAPARPRRRVVKVVNEAPPARPKRGR